VNRVGLSIVVLVAVLAGACADEDPGSTPTNPTSPTAPAPSSTPPPSNSCLPGAATNLAVSYPGGSTRVLTWAAGPRATAYDVQIGTLSGTANLVNQNTTQTSYTWTGQGSGTFYARVHSHNSCGSGPPSNEVTFQ
jgi:hypothetical protein